MRIIPILTSLAVAATPALAQKEAPPAPGTPKDFRLPPRKTVALPNGMKLTMVHYGTVPKVAVTLELGTGNIDESAAEVQLSGLTADMLLEGTTTRSSAGTDS